MSSGYNKWVKLTWNAMFLVLIYSLCDLTNLSRHFRESSLSWELASDWSVVILIDLKWGGVGGVRRSGGGELYQGLVSVRAASVWLSLMFWMDYPPSYQLWPQPHTGEGVGKKGERHIKVGSCCSNPPPPKVIRAGHGVWGVVTRWHAITVNWVQCHMWPLADLDLDWHVPDGCCESRGTVVDLTLHWINHIF